MAKAKNTPHNSGNEKKNVDKIPQRSSKKSKTAKDLVSTHLNDPNHVISDEDFKNLDTTPVTTPVPNEVTLTNGDERPHDEDKDHRFKTPWDVLKDE